MILGLVLFLTPLGDDAFIAARYENLDDCREAVTRNVRRLGAEGRVVAGRCFFELGGLPLTEVITPARQL